MLTGLRRYAGIGGGILRTHAFSLLAEGQLQAGRIQDALSTIDEAIANAHASGEVHFEPELHRIKGLALLTLAEAKGGPVEEALGSLERAIELAREQKARWLELRAATSLSRVLQARKMTARALELLAPVHASIVEGLDTREMKDAAALLDELRRG
jgi:predicted ATPase